MTTDLREGQDLRDLHAGFRHPLSHEAPRSAGSVPEGISIRRDRSGTRASCFFLPVERPEASGPDKGPPPHGSVPGWAPSLCRSPPDGIAACPGMSQGDTETWRIPQSPLQCPGRELPFRSRHQFQGTWAPGLGKRPILFSRPAARWTGTLRVRSTPPPILPPRKPRRTPYRWIHREYTPDFGQTFRLHKAFRTGTGIPSMRPPSRPCAACPA